MTNKFDALKENHEVNHSRRGMFKWIGQVAAGTSLAGFGLSLMSPSSAFASNGSKRLISKSSVGEFGHFSPNCTPCSTGCVFEGCVTDTVTCGVQTPLKSTIRQYKGGCIIPGQHCPYDTYVFCGNVCVSC